MGPTFFSILVYWGLGGDAVFFISESERRAMRPRSLTLIVYHQQPTFDPSSHAPPRKPTLAESSAGLTRPFNTHHRITYLNRWIGTPLPLFCFTTPDGYGFPRVCEHIKFSLETSKSTVHRAKVNWNKTLLQRRHHPQRSTSST